MIALKLIHFTETDVPGDLGRVLEKGEPAANAAQSLEQGLSEMTNPTERTKCKQADTTTASA